MQVRVDGQSARVVAEGDILGIAKCISLTRELKNLIDSGTRSLLLDIRESGVVTGSLCGFLVSVAEKAKEAGCRFSILVNRGSDSHDVLEVLNIEQVVDFYFSLDDAAKSSGKPD